jgi:glycosyltransferase involved in cell wall biosynthesis
VNILIAAWHLKDFNVGLGRYTRGLLSGLGEVGQENQYEIVTPEKINGLPPHHNITYRTVRIPFFKRRVWEQIAPLLCGTHDVLHLPYDSCVALKRGKLIVTIHDVKPLLFQTGRTRPHAIERLLMPDRRTTIDHVVTISEASRRDIIRHLGFPDDRITVVYPGVDLDRFHPRNDAEQTSAPKSRPYILCVGGADPTKNVETLIDAFGLLPQPLQTTYDLVFAGDFRRREDIRNRIAKAGIGQHVLFSGIVSDERLIDLYQHATVFVFPSRYEGFGLPVLEAMACGCPVICSNASSLPEVAGEAALLRDPEDVEGFAEEMKRVLMDGGLRQRLRERGLSQAAKFPWSRTAHETIAVYRHVLTQTYG